jgi:alginate O-acetyltransferase complex protein AlgI
VEFNSLNFIAFLILVWGLFHISPYRFRWVLMLLASYAFYMCWNAFYIVLIVASTLIDYCVGHAIAKTDVPWKRKALLVTSWVANLGLLFVFKYWNFFNTSAADICTAINLPWAVPNLNVLLPVGISFYTFQTLSYTIDIYRGQLRPEPNLGRFALYVSFFPQLVAGPIERAGRLLPQLRDPLPTDDASNVKAVVQILWGLFKKVVIADRLAIYVSAVYGHTGEHNGITCWLATYAFALQIYCDFSGYSDIAIGTARLFGIDLMKNFRSPYFAANLQDFWRRWHISLSTWLRDYLYISLGGSRRGQFRTSVNLLVTMLLGGLWHGASWNFVIWGALHGVALWLLRFTAEYRSYIAKQLKLPALLTTSVSVLLTFHFVCLTWVFFRAESLAEATLIVTKMATSFGMPFIDGLALANAAIGIAVLLIVDLYQWDSEDVTGWIKSYPRATAWVTSYLLLIGIVLFGAENGTQFIYFQF